MGFTWHHLFPDLHLVPLLLAVVLVAAVVMIGAYVFVKRRIRKILGVTEVHHVAFQNLHVAEGTPMKHEAA